MTISCCDCGLAHEFWFRHIKGKIMWRAKRNKLLTKLNIKNMEKECKHILDKNHKYCVICGCPVISRSFREATEKEKREWLENPYEFLRKKDILEQ